MTVKMYITNNTPAKRKGPLIEILVNKFVPTCEIMSTPIILK
jgi:hypothetical protein